VCYINKKEMRSRNLFNAVLFCFLAIAIYSCSKDDPSVVDDRSFITNTEVDFFINRDGTVNLTVNGTYNDGSNTFGEVVRREFVYGTTPKPTVNSTNTAIAAGSGNVIGVINNLQRNTTYFIRGFLEMNDGSFFYGNEIQASTNVDASNTRSITIEMITPKTIAIESTKIDGAVKVIEVVKESPIEIGLQYSINSDFSNAVTVLDNDFEGNVIVTSYFADATNLTPSTAYYFRPYAKYADGTITNGGTSTIIVTTTN